MNETDSLIDPELSLKLVSILSWALILLGAGKILIYAIGEWSPATYAKIRSDTARNFLTGKGNRFLFGLGGLITILLGLGGLALGQLFASLSRISF